jgi:hypothetical protein
MMKLERCGFPMDRVAVIVTCLAMLLAGCGGSLRGNASAGPNPGGGFYSPSNIDTAPKHPYSNGGIGSYARDAAAGMLIWS